MKSYQDRSVDLHREKKGKIEVVSKFSLQTKDDLSVAYTPGVAGPSLLIAKDKAEAFNLTATKNMVAVVSDGSAVLGLGDIGPEGAIPVMEGKAILFKEFGGVDAFPIVLNVHTVEEIVEAVKAISPTFGGINLEDISAPRCFEVEERLSAELDIPVFHDDQHGTAIVVLASLINALKITGKDISARVVVNGAGSAGIAITNLIHAYGFNNIIVCDSQGIISLNRKELGKYKERLLEFTNLNNQDGSVHDALAEADIFIGVSKGDLLSAEDITKMNKDAIIFAMANPTPEIMPEVAKQGGALVVATGRSDLPNQINNVLVFPGLFNGLFKVRAKKIDTGLKLHIAKSLASALNNPTAEKIIIGPFENPGQIVSASVVEYFKNNPAKLF